MTKISVICLLDEGGTSKLQDSLIKEIEPDFRKKINFLRLDVKKNSDAIAKYDIKELPSIVIEVNGHVKEKFSGLTQQLFLKRALDKIVKQYRI